MKKSEYEKQDWFRMIKGAQRDLIKAVGTIERAAKILDRSIAQVGRYFSWDTPEIMHIWEILALEAEAGRPVFSRAMAVWRGATVIDPPRDGVAGPGSLNLDFSKLTTEYAGFAHAFAEAASDGQFNDRELQKMKPEVEDVRRAAEDFLRTIDKRLAERKHGGHCD